VKRRDFLRQSAAMVAGLSVPQALGVRLTEPKLSPTTDYAPVINTIKQVLPVAMAGADITGASVALIDGGTIVWSEGFGYTDRSRKVKVTADTLFHLGSISKSFTALGVLKAIDKGLLALDDPVKKHVSGFSVNSRNGPAEAEKITVRHLLSHHSGLGTWSRLGNPADAQYHARTFDEVVKSIRDSWLKFSPGERFEYSNQGINLAGHVLQVISRQSLPDFMQQELLTPLGMTASTLDQKKATQNEGCALGYLGKRPVPIVNGVVMPLLAAGGLFASANDLARFVSFHLKGGNAQGKQLVSRSLLEEMYAPQFTAKKQISGYGLGIYKAIQHNTVRLSHGGLGYGISTHYRFLPEHKIGVVVLTNQDAAHNAPELASRVIELMLIAKLGREPRNEAVTATDKPIVSLDERTLRRLEGTYLLYEGILFRFKYEKGNLFHLVGNEKLKLDVHSASEFNHGSRLYGFLGEEGRPRGVQIIDPYYDPQTAENSVISLALNDRPNDERGLNKPEWSQLVGRYVGTFIGAASAVRVSTENGYLYLNSELRLTETKPGVFVTADGDTVIFSGQQLLVGNKLYSKK
jgi:CubicO group peptidase (beta-lactamase class C family)